jgi:hypothetical protein
MPTGSKTARRGSAATRQVPTADAESTEMPDKMLLVLPADGKKIMKLDRY